MKDALAAAHAMILSERAARLEVEAAAAWSPAVNRSTDGASGICSTLMINSYHFNSMRKCRRDYPDHKKCASPARWLWRLKFRAIGRFGKKIVAGFSRVAEPVRLLHRLNSFRPRRQVLSLSCGLVCLGVQITGFFMVAPPVTKTDSSP